MSCDHARIAAALSMEFWPGGPTFSNCCLLPLGQVTALLLTACPSTQKRHALLLMSFFDSGHTGRWATQEGLRNCKDR